MHQNLQGPLGSFGLVLLQARDLLERVAKQVQPLLRRHQLRVPLLSEFFPHNPNLLVREASANQASSVAASCIRLPESPLQSLELRPCS